MKILVYGTGPLGSLFAARLHQAGHDVSILARGKRLEELGEHGIVLEDAQTGEQSVAKVTVVERLDAEDAYDLVLVIMRKNHAAGVLPALAANRRTPNVLFLMNNAAGPGEFVQALGKERVLIGFPSSAGYRRGHAVCYLGGSAERQMTIPFGEVDGHISERTLQVAEVLRSMPGYTAEIRVDMDAWLKTHVALLMPSIAPALYATGTDNERLARTRDGLVLAARAIREGFQVLRALVMPITPSSMRLVELLPEPLLIPWARRIMEREQMKTALVGHAEAARDELKHLTDEFLVLARQTTVPTPNIERLYMYFDPATPLIPDGSAEIPLDWRSIRRGLAVGLATLLSLALISRWLSKRTRR
ncbi:MAG: ketopantoate reductase family protein [Anaerolineales bacterium]|nr:ketopantoate reductase family protein [Anaerolineales bacterium]